MAVGAMLLLSCQRQIELFDDDNLFEVDGGSAEQPSWGVWAAGLSVPPCPDGRVWIVNSTTEELDAGLSPDGGPALSFTEAMKRAQAMTGPDTILFDAEVFPHDRPGRILLTHALFADDASPLCIDGRNRGVVFEWSATRLPFPQVWSLRNGSLQVGLTLLNPPYQMMLLASQVAGCRLGTDGTHSLERGVSTVMLAEGATFGPGNVITGVQYALRVDATPGTLVRIQDNFFGYDPITRLTFAPRTAVSIRSGDVDVARNVFVAQYISVSTALLFGPSTLEFTENRVGIDFQDRPLPGALLLDAWSGTNVVGPGNVVRSSEIAIRLNDVGSKTLLTRNSFPPDSIEWADGGSVPPPNITEASTHMVSGTCPVSGTVEVFGVFDGGTAFLGAVPCGESFSFPSVAPVGDMVTATLTDLQGVTSRFSSPVFAR